MRVIVEDIGPKGGLPGVKKLKTKTGWPGIKILMFAFDDDTANEHLPHNYQDTNMVVYAGTHDTKRSLVISGISQITSWHICMSI